MLLVQSHTVVLYYPEFPLLHITFSEKPLAFVCFTAEGQRPLRVMCHKTALTVFLCAFLYEFTLVCYKMFFMSFYITDDCRQTNQRFF